MEYLALALGHIDPAAAAYTWTVNYEALDPQGEIFDCHPKIRFLPKANIKEIDLIWSEPYRHDTVYPAAHFPTSTWVEYDVTAPLQSGGHIYMTAHMLDNSEPWHLVLEGNIFTIRPPAAYEGFCDVFGGIRDKCHNISEHFGQLAALGSSWWLIDSITDTLFGGISTFFSELGDFFDMLRDWCIAVTSALGEALDLDTVTAYLNSQFHLEELWQWLTTRDDWLLAQKDTVKTWVLGSYSSLDEWLATKDFPSISEILGGFASLDAWLDGQAAKIKALILGSYSSLDAWLASKLEYLADELALGGVEILDFLLDTVDAWLDARVEKVKAFIEKLVMKL